jgi:hypothetical protein
MKPKNGRVKEKKGNYALFHLSAMIDRPARFDTASGRALKKWVL